MAFFTLLTGVIYPLFVTLAAQGLFPFQAAGSLMVEHDRLIGSRLIGQPAAGTEWFWPRPSAVAWNAAASGGANLAPVTAPQQQAWAERAAALRASGLTGTLPGDLVTASGSGLDPHLSPAAALAQVPRIAAARGLDPEKVRQVVAEHIVGPQLGLLGPPCVTVLELNLALTRLVPGGH
jgi:K+-transporting ATPase ATPase C chain